MTNTEVNALNVVIEIKKCLVYYPLCAFEKYVANISIRCTADRYILLVYLLMT